jgi:hypothetical protein
VLHSGINLETGNPLRLPENRAEPRLSPSVKVETFNRWEIIFLPIFLPILLGGHNDNS